MTLLFRKFLITVFGVRFSRIEFEFGLFRDGDAGNGFEGRTLRHYVLFRHDRVAQSHSLLPCHDLGQVQSDDTRRSVRNIVAFIKRTRERKSERERKKTREEQRNRQTEREKEREKQREKERERERKREKEREKQRERERERERETERERERERETEREGERETERES